MLDIIRHRGPDDEGWAAFSGDDLAVRTGGGRDTPASAYAANLSYAPRHGNFPHDALLAIGHRRLSIVDIATTGHQPMCQVEGRYWIVFNGEIYNHRELRCELEALGHRFNSHSDTEVILAAYAEWGECCLERFQGMFAFALVDRFSKKLFVARDRFGIKPLYYWIAPGPIIAFASEIKQFSTLPGWAAELNGQRAYDFLAWSLLDHTDETMFRGVFQVPAAGSLTIDLLQLQPPEPGTRLATRKWYRLASRPFAGNLGMAAAGFREQFEESVRAHLRADVPVGSCLSGGLDSSSIVCMANEILRREQSAAPQHTFSSCSIVKRFDEREYVEEVVRHTGVHAHYIYPDLSGLFSDLERIVWHQDEPFGSTSIFAQWSVFALAAEAKVKVMLDGQGADEQLAGYPTYHGANFASLFRQLRWLELAREMSATSQLHGHGLAWAAQYLANGVLPGPLRRVLRGFAGKGKARPIWLDIDRLGARPGDSMHDGGSAPMSIHELSYQQLTRSNLQMLLHWEDRDSMAHSIEARVPFLDHRLVEFTLGLPDAAKLHRGVTKRVLREGLKGVLPESIRARTSKLGFSTPEEYWVREQAPDRFRQAICEAVDAAGGILRPSAIETAEQMIVGSRPFDFSLWRMISFAAWMNKFGVATA